ncbi:hypothetical protein UA3_01137 [Enterococcus faecium EnGen0263]|uniref:hypothetical protein n=1 Tax=Enterococcus faecium TaxID=1352 RepID=UPI000330C525|nr:hypothetical protein [Enterococcus faecium]EOH55954.1 hypothetical protein UA3_01137 [Enterococcus faecium EnGen0263]
MKLEITLVGNQDNFIVEINDGRTLQDVFDELAEVQNGTFIMLGDHILQKPTIERIKRN